MYRWHAGAILALLLVALALQPRWLAGAIAFPAWLGGFWRAWLLPVAIAGWFAIVLTNATATGSAWTGTLYAARRLARHFPAAVALLIGVLAVALSAGAVTATSLVRALVLL